MPEVSRRSMIGAAMAILPATAWAASEDPVVTTRSGRIRGTREAGLQVFRGVRYGQDSGLRRFQAPVAPEHWRDIRPATPMRRPARSAPGRTPPARIACFSISGRRGRSGGPGGR